MSGRIELRQATLISQQPSVPGTGTLTAITVSAPITGGGAGPVVPIGATQMDATHAGFVPSPGVHNHTKILWDDGWFLESADAEVSLQASTPGTAQTGNTNITGTGIFGAVSVINATPDDSAVAAISLSATDTNAHTSTVSLGIELPGDGVSPGDLVANGAGITRINTAGGLTVRGEFPNGQELLRVDPFGSNAVWIGDPPGSPTIADGMLYITSFRNAGSNLRVTLNSGADDLSNVVATEISMAGAWDAASTGPFLIRADGSGAGTDGFSIQDEGTATGGFANVFLSYQEKPSSSGEPRMWLGHGDLTVLPDSTVVVSAGSTENTGLRIDDNQGASDPFLALGNLNGFSPGWKMVVDHNAATLTFSELSPGNYQGGVIVSATQGTGLTALVTSSNPAIQATAGTGLAINATGDVASSGNVDAASFSSAGGVPYILPATNGAGVLTNDGAGNLSWV